MKSAVPAPTTPYADQGIPAGPVCDLVTDRPTARPLGDDRLEVGRLRRRLDHHLAADREPDAADFPGIYVGLALQECDGRADVPFALPPERVRVALALALTAAVEEQHPVSVACEELGPLLRGGSARERDDGGPVARRDVPALQAEAVGGRELDVLVGGAEVLGGNRGACRMRHDVRDREREQDHVREDEGAGEEQEPAEVPPPTPVVGSPRSPQRDSAEADEQQTGRDREQPREVVAGRTDFLRVVDCLRSGQDAEEAGQERDRRAGARA